MTEAQAPCPRCRGDLVLQQFGDKDFYSCVKCGWYGKALPTVAAADRRRMAPIGGKLGTAEGPIQPGSIAWMKSGTEGWVEVEVMDIRGGMKPSPAVGGVMIGGPEEVFVRWLKGKHKGESRWVPSNYVATHRGS